MQRFGSLLIILFVLLQGTVWAQDKAMVWQVCLPDHGIPPYLSEPGKAPGITERLISDAAARIHLSVVFVRVPSTRCMALMRMGLVEAGVSGAADENLQFLRFPLREGKLDASRRVIALRQVWVKRSDYALDWDGKNLLHVAPHNVRVGTLQLNRVAADSLAPLGVVVDNAAYNVTQLLQKLEARRVDAAVLFQEEFDSLRGNRVTKDLTVLPLPLRAADYYLAAKPTLTMEEQGKMDAWWTAIATLRDTPAYKPR